MIITIKIEGVQAVVQGLDNVINGSPRVVQGAANIAGRMVVEKARSFLGSKGPKGVRWPPIKPITYEKRIANKNPNPLLDLGELRSSIRIVERGGGTVVVEATSIKAATHEYGGIGWHGARIPPRPYMRPAVNEVANNKTFNKKLETFIDQKIKGLYEGRGYTETFFKEKYSAPKKQSIQKKYKLKAKSL